MTISSVTTVLVALVLGALIGIGGMSILREDSQGAYVNQVNHESMMHAEMEGMMQGLSGKTGDAFDQAFLQEMIVHHEGALQMAEAALQNAKHQEIKDLASSIIAAQQSEIAQMRTWLMSWYNN